MTYDLSGPSVQSSRDEITIAVRPGPHKVWIDRRGFEPIEERFEALAGKDHTIRAEWHEFGEAATSEGGTGGLSTRVLSDTGRQAASATQPASPTPKASEVAESPEPGEPGPMEPEIPALDPEAEKRLAAEARYAEAMQPVDALIAAWDFNGASAALAKLQFPEVDVVRRGLIGKLHTITAILGGWGGSGVATPEPEPDPEVFSTTTAGSARRPRRRIRAFG